MAAIKIPNKNDEMAARFSKIREIKIWKIIMI